VIVDELPLFTAPVPPGHRARDPETSKAADAGIRKVAGPLRAQVLQVLQAHPDGLTDRELERRAEFASYGPSTVRKRRSELYQMGYLRPNGTRDGLTVWAPTEGH
jgi:hypothetical protein